ncbi:MAG: nicotinate (nicotinamide) nucleotide adenylyltransferase [Chitinophagaceae bacterium]
MNIGLYFGSFNPIHTGHCIIANHVINHTVLEQVWFVLSPQNPFKQSASLLNEYHRLHLVKVAIETESNLKASDIEFNMPRPSFTIDTLTYITEKYPQHLFAVIMGSDGFQNISKWKNYNIILANYHLYVYTRAGFEIEANDSKSLTVLDAPLLQISSTRIREYIRQHKSIRYLVPDKVMEEITNNGYFK